MVTLAQLKVENDDKLCAGVIEEFQKNSILMDSMEYDDAVGVTGGSTLAYGYLREKTEAGAGTRAVGSDYTANEATTERVVTNLAILGGSFEIDRVIAKASEGAYVDEVAFQTAKKVKATKNAFSNLIINGDKTSDVNAFDGLDKILTGSSTEFTSNVDLSTSANVTANAAAFVDEIEEVMSNMDGVPTFIVGNTKAINKIKAIARRLTMYTETKDEFGRNVSKYGDSILLDIGKFYDKANEQDIDIIPTDGTAGTTDIYFIRLGKDGFHGITLRDGQMITANAPDFSTAGTVKKGDVEAVLGVALKSTKAAAVLRGVKVQ